MCASCEHTGIVDCGYFAEEHVFYFVVDMWDSADDDEIIYNDLCTGSLVSSYLVSTLTASRAVPIQSHTAM